MKKTVFAVKVLGLVALFPIVVFLEMNHVSPQKNTPAPGIIKTENTITGLPVKAEDKLSREALSASLETSLLKVIY